MKIYSFAASTDLTLPAGGTIIIGTFKIHRHAEIYTNPDKFDPDNFLPERTANRHYYAFIPFSAGPRSCVGKFTKNIFSSLYLFCEFNFRSEIRHAQIEDSSIYNLETLSSQIRYW